MKETYTLKHDPIVRKIFLAMLAPTILMNLTTAIGSMADTVIIDVGDSLIAHVVNNLRCLTHVLAYECGATCFDDAVCRQNLHGLQHILTTLQ